MGFVNLTHRGVRQVKMIKKTIIGYMTASYIVLTSESVPYTSEGKGRGITDRVGWEGGRVRGRYEPANLGIIRLTRLNTVS